MPALLIESLRDQYSAETRLIQALPKMAKAATNPDLKQAFEVHLSETMDQKARLEGIFKALNESPDGHTCAAMKGLIKEAEDAIESVTDADVRDAAIIGMAQKIEHYEIAGYGTARTFARLLNHNDHADTLQSILDEEYHADDTLTGLAEGFVNRAAKSTAASASK